MLYELIGCTLASDFPYIKPLFDYMKVQDDGVLDLDEYSDTWTTAVIVFTGPIHARIQINPWNHRI